MSIVDQLLTTINRVFSAFASNVTIEHAIDHHRLDIVVKVGLTVALHGGSSVIAY